MELIIDLCRYEKDFMKRNLDNIFFNKLIKILNSSYVDKHLQLGNIAETHLSEYLYS